MGNPFAGGGGGYALELENKRQEEQAGTFHDGSCHSCITFFEVSRQRGLYCDIDKAVLEIVAQFGLTNVDDFFFVLVSSFLAPGTLL